MTTARYLMLLCFLCTGACFGGASLDKDDLGGDGDGDSGDGDSGDGDGDGDSGGGDGMPPEGMGSGVPDDTLLEEVTQEQFDALCQANIVNITVLEDRDIQCTQQGLSNTNDTADCEAYEAECRSRIQVDPNGDDKPCSMKGGDGDGDAPPMNCDVTVMELESCFAQIADYLRGLSCDNVGSTPPPPGCMDDLVVDCPDLFGDMDGGGDDDPPMCNGEYYDINRSRECHDCGSYNCCDEYSGCENDSNCDCFKDCLARDGSPPWGDCQKECEIDPNTGNAAYDKHQQCIENNCDSICN